METENTQSPSQGQVQPIESLGFIALLKASFQILKQNWKHFVKMTLALMIPALVLGGLIFLVATSFQSKAHAAPSIPTQITDNTVATGKNTPAPATVPQVSDTTLPVAASAQDVTNSAKDTPAKSADNVVVGTTQDTKISINSSSLNSSGAMAVIGVLMSVMGLIILVLSIPFIIYMLVAGLAMIKLTILVTQGAEIKIWEIIKWAFTKIGSYLMLALRVLIYAAWPFIIVLLLAGLNLFINIGILNSILFILWIASFIYFIIRGPRASFAKYALAEKDCTSKEALDTSVIATKGHWWKIVGYGFFLGLIISILSGILVGIFSKISQPLGSVISAIISIAGGYVATIFYYALFNLCRMLNERKTA